MCGSMPVVANIFHLDGCICWGLAQWPPSCRCAANWAIWCVMAGPDDRAWLCGIHEAPGLNSQVEYLESNNNVVLENGQTIGFECFVTREGKGMHVSNHSPVTECSTCEDGNSLEAHDNLKPMARWGVYLRALRRTKRRSSLHIARHGFAMQLPSD